MVSSFPTLYSNYFCSILTLYHRMTTFDAPEEQVLKTLWEGKGENAVNKQCFSSINDKFHHSRPVFNVVCISIGECNTILSAYTKYALLGYYCSHPYAFHQVHACLVKVELKIFPARNTCGCGKSRYLLKVTR